MTVIPLPTASRRLILDLDLRAHAPTAASVVVYDPTKPHTDYFRRRMKFPQAASKGYQDRRLTVPLPLTPERLELEIDTPNSSDLDLRDVQVRPMPPMAVWASPERHRFMEFVMDFAQKAGYAKPGFYASPNDEFLIQYLPSIQDEQGKDLVTPARIHRLMPRIQASRQQMVRFTVPMRVAVFSHEVSHFMFNTRSEKKADLNGIDYFVHFGFPRIEGIYALTKIFLQHRDSVGPAHLQRVRDVDALLSQFDQRFDMTRA